MRQHLLIRHPVELRQMHSRQVEFWTRRQGATLKGRPLEHLLPGLTKYLINTLLLTVFISQRPYIVAPWQRWALQTIRSVAVKDLIQTVEHHLVVNIFPFSHYGVVTVIV